MKKTIALMITAAMLFALASCGKKPEQTTEAPTAATAAAETPATDAMLTEASETTEETVFYETPAWEGKWQAADTDEHFEIYDVTDDGFKMVFYHFEEGQIEEFKYTIEFDNPEKTIASELGSADGGRWEYTFNFKGDSILVQSKHPDQIYNRVVE
ncbi:MAG: hypothetical protein IKF09_00490 [Clostridiales bacterium]|nr:hypothetical protein [Clostridiales bacterium]